MKTLLQSCMNPPGKNRLAILSESARLPEDVLAVKLANLFLESLDDETFNRICDRAETGFANLFLDVETTTPDDDGVIDPGVDPIPENPNDPEVEQKFDNPEDALPDDQEEPEPLLERVDTDALSIPIEEAGLKTRPENCLVEHGMLTVGMALTVDLGTAEKEWDGFGAGSSTNIEDTFIERGWADSPDDFGSITLDDLPESAILEPEPEPEPEDEGEGDVDAILDEDNTSDAEDDTSDAEDDTSDAEDDTSDGNVDAILDEAEDEGEGTVIDEFNDLIALAKEAESTDEVKEVFKDAFALFKSSWPDKDDNDLKRSTISSIRSQGWDGNDVDTYPGALEWMRNHAPMQADQRDAIRQAGSHLERKELELTRPESKFGRALDDLTYGQAQVYLEELEADDDGGFDDLFGDDIDDL